METIKSFTAEEQEASGSKATPDIILKQPWERSARCFPSYSYADCHRIYGDLLYGGSLCLDGTLEVGTSVVL